MILPWIGAACRATRAVMLDGLEGRLRTRARLDVEAHLARCMGCADELADLAALRHAILRAYLPYRRLRASVAPGRARLRAAGARPRLRLLELLARIGRPAEQGLVFAVLALVFAGALTMTEQEAQPARDVAAPVAHVRVVDDLGGLARLRYLQGRLPVGDALVIDVSATATEPAPIDRTREGLARVYPR